MSRKDSIDAERLTDTTFYILSSLIEEKHGYLIMKNIEELTQGNVTIGPASLYTTLKKLLKAELIKLKLDEDRNRKKYILTKKGMEMLLKEVKRKKDMIKFAEYFLNIEGSDDCEK